MDTRLVWHRHSRLCGAPQTSKAQTGVSVPHQRRREQQGVKAPTREPRPRFWRAAVALSPLAVNVRRLLARRPYVNVLDERSTPAVAETTAGRVHDPRER